MQNPGNFPKVPIKVGGKFFQMLTQPPTNDDNTHQFFDKCQMHVKYITEIFFNFMCVCVIFAHLLIDRVNVNKYRIIKATK